MPALELALELASKHVDSVRMKIISFCDLNNLEHLSSIEESRFFNITDRNSLDIEYYASAWSWR